MRKKMASILTTAATVIAFSGCGLSETGTTYQESDLTDAQKTVLEGSTWFLDDEGQLTDGKIDIYEQDILEKYDEVIPYLQEKYPDHEVQVTSYLGGPGEAEIGIVSYRFEFIFTEYPDESCTVTKGKKSKSFSDNGFDVIRKKDYEEILTEYIESLGETVLNITGSFGSNYGMFDTTLPIESYFTPEYYEMIRGLQAIYVDSKGRTEEECKESLEQIQEYFTEHHVYGSPKILYVTAYYGEYDKDLIVYSEVFNVFYEEGE